MNIWSSIHIEVSTRNQTFFAIYNMIRYQLIIMTKNFKYGKKKLLTNKKSYYILMKESRKS